MCFGGAAVADVLVGALRDEQPVGRRRALEAGGEVDGGPHDRVRGLGRPSGDDEPRVDAHADGEIGQSVGFREVGGQPAGLGDHVERGTDGHLGIVLMGQRQPEHREVPVAHEPRDPPS